MTHDELLAEGLIRVPEAARFLSIARSTLYLLMDKGELPYVRLGSARRIPKVAVLELAKKNLIGVQEQAPVNRFSLFNRKENGSHE